MSAGAITSHIDVAQVVLYLFWFFFAGLCYYLHRENKREGYPLEPSANGRAVMQGWPAVPDPKAFKLANGETRYAPGPNSALQPLKGARLTFPAAGSPIEPTGHLLLGGVGPGAYADRVDRPDVTVDGTPRIVPLRADPDFGVDSKDPDPRGFLVIGADDKVAGIVRELWVDRSEFLFRYLEVEVDAAGGKRNVLLPLNFTRINRREVKVASILAHQFAEVPGLKNPDLITSLEEEKITAYFGAGTLYATPARQEPLM